MGMRVRRFVVNGQLVVAAEGERFNRIRQANGLRSQAMWSLGPLGCSSSLARLGSC
jgi:hypothetical protein